MAVMEWVMVRLMEVRVHSSGQRSLSSEEEPLSHTYNPGKLR